MEDPESRAAENAESSWPPKRIKHPKVKVTN